MTLNIPNLDRLISYLEALPPEEFHMAHTEKGDHQCETACCLGGHIGILIGTDYTGAFEFLGKYEDLPYGALFCPKGWYNEEDGNKAYPLSRALRMLRYLRAEFLHTGNVVVDWDAPEAVEPPRKAWGPPQVIGADKELPSSLTKFVRELAPEEHRFAADDARGGGATDPSILTDLTPTMER